MAQQYDDRNRGALFKVKEKKSEKSPDVTGNLDVEGKKFRLAGWFKKAKSGLIYTSLSIQPDEKAEQEASDSSGDSWGEAANNDGWG